MPTFSPAGWLGGQAGPSSGSRGHFPGDEAITLLSSFQIQRLAIRCIQKNVAVYQAVKTWPWWELMCRLRPLLSANLQEGQLRAKEVGGGSWGIW